MTEKPPAGSSQIGHELLHDLLNFVTSAKMNVDLAMRHGSLPDPVKLNLQRIKQNLIDLQLRLEGTPPVTAVVSPSDATAVAASGASEVAAKRVPEAPTRATSEKTILVIDDSEDIRSLFKIVLKSHGYSVSLAGSVEKALQVLAVPPFPHLILLDYTLGDKTATDLLDALESNASEVFNKSKIVMLTGHGKAIREPRASLVEQKAMDTASLVALVKSFFVD